jgi:hypothetical protein
MTKKYDAFISWCQNQNLDFLSMVPDRKQLKGETRKLSYRLLCVLDEKFHGKSKVQV